MGVRFEKFVSAVGGANLLVGRSEGLEEAGQGEAKRVKKGRLILAQPPFLIELSLVIAKQPTLCSILHLVKVKEVKERKYLFSVEPCAGLI